VPIAIQLDFTLRQGSFTIEIRERIDTHVLALVGPSGSGKTSIVEAIAGLRTPDVGEIRVGERCLFSSSQRIDLPARDRAVGYVPQDAALFPHFDVRRNILYGARRRDSTDLDHILKMLEIAPLVDRRIDRLSGGERQRVALARALMASPSLLLLDEPFAGLDPSLRERILPYLRRVRDDLGVPMICVSHESALVDALADRVLALERGRVVFSGPPGARPSHPNV
jgi:molybdate transport system ATP-binding protein